VEDADVVPGATYGYRVRLMDVAEVLAEFEVSARAAPAPEGLWLDGPSPFVAGTRVGFELDAPADVSLRVLDPSGRVVRTLVAGHLPAGTHLQTWDGRDVDGRRVRAGVYFCALRAGGHASVVRLLRVD